MKSFKITVTNGRETYSWIEEFEEDIEVLKPGEWNAPFAVREMVDDLLTKFKWSTLFPPVFDQFPINNVKIEEMVVSYTAK